MSSIDWRPMGDAAVLMALPGTAVGGASGAAAPKGVREVVVGLDSVLLRLEPGGDPAAAVRAFAASLDERADGGEGSTIEVPTAFDGDDLATVAAAAGLAARDVVELMVRATFEVAAIGFSPGFPYLRGLPAQLAGVGRRPTPRPVVPAGSVAVAGGMGAIYPQASPGGWQLVGRTPLRLFDAHRAPYALFAPGDRLHFVEAPAGVAPDTTRAAERRIGDEGTVLVEDPGTYCTVQDAGRRGVAHLGVPDAGAADAVSLDLANRLVGNDATAPALEATVRGPVLRFGADTFVAVVGDCGLELDGIEARPGTAFPVRAGQRLTVGALRSGVRAYVAFAGGVLVDAWFDSASTDTLSGLGPGPVVAGQRLAVGPAAGAPGGHLVSPGPRRGRGPIELRVILGPHTEFFDADLAAQLAATALRVGEASNRVGVRLVAERPLPRRDTELRSTPMVVGAVQVPPDGQPIILGVDHATLGGYPVAAVVVGADLALLGQCRPGEDIRLVPVSFAEARRAAAAAARQLRRAVVGRYPTEPA